MPVITEITDLAAPELAVYTECTENELRHYYEPHGGVFIAESPKVIERALAAGCRPISVLVEKEQVSGEAAQLLERLACETAGAADTQAATEPTGAAGGLPVYTVPAATLSRITGYPMTRGMLCAMHRPALPDARTLCAKAHRVAVLEGVVNPTNIGAIIRSAAAMHVDAVLLAPGCCDPLYRRAIRVSMGCVFQIPWTYLDKAADGGGLDFLKEMGFVTAAMALVEGAQPIDEAGLAAMDKLAIVLGAEGDGLRAATIKACDHAVIIPMSHGVDSLNVAAASAVAFWEMRYRADSKKG